MISNLAPDLFRILAKLPHAGVLPTTKGLPRRLRDHQKPVDIKEIESFSAIGHSLVPLAKGRRVFSPKRICGGCKVFEAPIWVWISRIKVFGVILGHAGTTVSGTPPL